MGRINIMPFKKILYKLSQTYKLHRCIIFILNWINYYAPTN